MKARSIRSRQAVISDHQRASLTGAPGRPFAIARRWSAQIYQVQTQGRTARGNAQPLEVR